LFFDSVALLFPPASRAPKRRWHRRTPWPKFTGSGARLAGLPLMR